MGKITKTGRMKSIYQGGLEFPSTLIKNKEEEVCYL